MLCSDSVAGRPLLRGAATLDGSSVPHGHEAVSEIGRFCAGHMISVCLALTLCRAETGPLLRWARFPLLCPYSALGLGFGAYASARVPDPWPFPCEPPSFGIGRTLLVLAAEKPEPCPLRFGARLAGARPTPATNRPELCGSPLSRGACRKRCLANARSARARLACVRRPRGAWRALPY